MKYVRALWPWLFLAFAVAAFLLVHTVGAEPAPVGHAKRTVARVEAESPKEVPNVATEPLAALTGMASNTPTDCVLAEITSARGYLAVNYGETARWEYSNMYYGGLTYAQFNLIVIDSDMNGTCGYGFAVAYHEWMHIRTAQYYGTMTKAVATIGCGPDMPEFVNTCRNLELIADCGALWLAQQTGVSEHHPYLDVYGCSQEQMAMAQLIIRGR